MTQQPNRQGEQSRSRSGPDREVSPSYRDSSGKGENNASSGSAGEASLAEERTRHRPSDIGEEAETDHRGGTGPRS